MGYKITIFPMKKILTLLFIIAFHVIGKAQHLNTDDGYMAKGYDVVAYHSQEAVKGKQKYSVDYNGATYLFSTPDNLSKFKKQPKNYAPQFGGYCAYAIGKKGKKVDIDPKTFEIRDGKLYLFYNSWGINTFEKWKEEGA